RSKEKRERDAREQKQWTVVAEEREQRDENPVPISERVQLTRVIGWTRTIADGDFGDQKAAGQCLDRQLGLDLEALRDERRELEEALREHAIPRKEILGLHTEQRSNEADEHLVSERVLRAKRTRLVIR